MKDTDVLNEGVDDKDVEDESSYDDTFFDHDTVNSIKNNLNPNFSINLSIQLIKKIYNHFIIFYKYWSM